MRETGDLDNQEIVRALRLDVAAEMDATHIYTAQAFRIKNPVIKNSLLSIANEERVHSGELLRLIMEIDMNEAAFLDKGMREVEEREQLEHHVIVEMMAEEIRDRKMRNIYAEH
jgi:rubrerythrin